MVATNRWWVEDVLGLARIWCCGDIDFKGLAVGRDSQPKAGRQERLNRADEGFAKRRTFRAEALRASDE